MKETQLLSALPSVELNLIEINGRLLSLLITCAKLARNYSDKLKYKSVN